MKTLALNSDWDLMIVSGNLASLDGPAAIAQDVASAVRLFSGELWYDTSQGIQYFETVLGRAPPLGVLGAQFVKAGMTVPEVSRIRPQLNALDATRQLTGTLSITDTRGRISSLTIP